MSTHREVRVTRRYEASAERVFDAWLDPQKAGKFLFATPTGQMVNDRHHRDRGRLRARAGVLPQYEKQATQGWTGVLDGLATTIHSGPLGDR